MKLTTACLLRILLHYGVHGKIQTKLVIGIYNSILDDDVLVDSLDHSPVSKAVKGTAPVNTEVRTALDTLDFELYKKNLNRNVCPLLKPYGKTAIIIAFQKIFKEDKSLDENTVIDPFNGFTKQSFCASTSFDFVSVLGAMIVFAFRNFERETDDSLSYLDENFYRLCEKHARRISLIPLTISIPIQICEAPQIVRVQKCQRCGKSSSSTVSVNGIPIFLCEECETHVLALNIEEKNELLKSLKQDFDNQKFMEDFPVIVSDEEIEDVLKRINSLGALDEVQLSIKAVDVSEKVGNGFLCRTIQNSNSINYSAINGVLSRFDIKNESGSNRFREQIRSMFFKLVEVSPDMAKDEMIEKLVDALCEHSDVRYRSAARALIYYSIQSCEVFYAPAK